MTPQKSFDDLDRGCSRGECRWLRRDHATGMVVEEGLVSEIFSSPKSKAAKKKTEPSETE